MRQIDNERGNQMAEMRLHEIRRNRRRGLRVCNDPRSDSEHALRQLLRTRQDTRGLPSIETDVFMEQQLYQFEKAFFPNLHAGRATSSLVHNYSNAVQETNQHEINRALAY